MLTKSILITVSPDTIYSNVEFRKFENLIKKTLYRTCLLVILGFILQVVLNKDSMSQNGDAKFLRIKIRLFLSMLIFETCHNGTVV